MESKEQQKRVKDLLKEAVEQKDISATIGILREINRRLSGLNEVPIVEDEIRSFFNEMEVHPLSEPELKVYLGGGMLRLFIFYNSESGVDFLLSQASEEEKKQWDEMLTI